MKKLFLVLALAFVGIFTANAQVWIGGSANATINKNVTNFAIAPEVGYSFTGTPWTIAVAANYTFNKFDQMDATNGLILSPYVRYSICNIEKFALFMDLTGDFDVTSKTFGYRVGLQPGIAWMATKHWTAAFRFAFIGYNHCNYYGDEGFRMNFATSAPGFGLYYNF
jgi:hypothetical protein